MKSLELLRFLALDYLLILNFWVTNASFSVNTLISSIDTHIILNITEKI